jgi:Peptidase family M28
MSCRFIGMLGVFPISALTMVLGCRPEHEVNARSTTTTEEGAFDAAIGICEQAGTIDDALRRASKMLDSPIKLREMCLGRSDHEHFWDADLPAVVLTDGAIYDGYHKPCDRLDALNISYLRSMIRLAVANALLAAPTNES